MSVAGMKNNLAKAAQQAVATQNGEALPANPKEKPLDALLLEMKPELEKALPQCRDKKEALDRVVRVIRTEINFNAELMECDKLSVIGAVCKSTELGLIPSNALGHAYLVPFNDCKRKDGKKVAQLIIGYRGFIELARRSGQILSINAYSVHDGDDFYFEYGLNPTITHRPRYDIRDSYAAEQDSLVFVYAVAELKGGGKQFVVMHKSEIEKIRESSASGKSGYSPWAKHYEEMAKKTAIRRLFKLLPISLETAEAASFSDAGENGRQTYTYDGEFKAYEAPSNTIDTETGEIFN